jgi:uncharacterized membrane protein YcaP (DUF421 family)
MEMGFFFRGWEPLLRIAVVGTLGYIGLLVLLRASGKRTLSQMSAFDFLITLALGATYGRVMTAQDVPVLELVLAFAVLIGLQYAVSWGRVRYERLAGAVSRPPRLLFYRGSFQREAMRQELVTEAELRTALREQGAGSHAGVEAVVLEPNGRISVIPRTGAGDGSALGPLVPDAVEPE